MSLSENVRSMPTFLLFVLLAATTINVVNFALQVERRPSALTWTLFFTACTLALFILGIMIYRWWARNRSEDA